VLNLVETEIKEDLILEENTSNPSIQEDLETCDSPMQNEFYHEVIGDIFQDKEVFHDRVFKTPPFFDDYGDSDVEDQE
jgi:hypothetical protein